MPPVNLLIKPASGNCNLRCKYCFYTDVMDKRETKDYGMMTKETLEAVVKQLLMRQRARVPLRFKVENPLW